MSSGNLITGSWNDPYFRERTWTGNDDHEQRAEMPYSLYLREHKSQGTVLKCDYGCTSCVPVAGTYPHMIDAVFSGHQQAMDAIQLARWKATQRLLAAVRGHGLDLGNAIAEGDRTVGMALGAMARIANAAKSLKKGDADGVLRALGGGSAKAKPFSANGNLNLRGHKEVKQTDISDAHLAMTYGVMPLLSDVMESAQAWNAVTAQPRKFKLRGRGKHVTGTFEVPENASYYTFSGKLTVKVEIRVRLLEELSAPRSLGLYDPLGIAWELMPYSFIADWFLPIGDYLDALSILPHLNTSEVWETVTTVQNGIAGHTIYPYGCEWKTGYSFESLVHEEKIIRCTRSPGSLSGGSLPTPRFKPLSKAFSGAHIANAAALLHQKLAGIRNPRLP